MERTFYISARYEIVEITLLLSSVPYEYLRRIPLLSFRKLIEGKIEENAREIAWEMWLKAYHYMLINPDVFIPFDDFYKKKKKEKSIEEARKEVAEAVQAFEEVGD